jgi:hypothetical protein
MSIFTETNIHSAAATNGKMKTALVAIFSASQTAFNWMITKCFGLGSSRTLLSEVSPQTLRDLAINPHQVHARCADVRPIGLNHLL